MVDPSVVCDYKLFVLVNYVVSFDCPQRLQKYVIVNLGSSSLTMLHQTFWGETAQSLGRETKNYQGPSYILFPTIFWSNKTTNLYKAQETKRPCSPQIESARLSSKVVFVVLIEMQMG